MLGTYILPLYFRACFVGSLNGMIKERIWMSDLNRCLKWTFISFTASGTHGCSSTDFGKIVQILTRKMVRNQPGCSCVRLDTYSQISVSKFGKSGLIL